MHRSIETVLNRRSAMTAVAALPVAACAPPTAAEATEPDPYSPEAVAQRVADFADAMDAPRIAVTTDVDGKTVLSDALIDWCRAHGASLDWICCGDMRGTLRAARSVFLKAQAPTDPLVGMVAEWRALDDECNDISADIADDDPRIDVVHKLARQICETAPTTLEGAIAYLDWLWADLGYHLEECCGDPYNRALTTLRASLRGLAS